MDDRKPMVEDSPGIKSFTDSSRLENLGVACLLALFLPVLIPVLAIFMLLDTGFNAAQCLKMNGSHDYDRETMRCKRCGQRRQRVAKASCKGTRQFGTKADET